jgi:hypothetical protein
MGRPERDERLKWRSVSVLPKDFVAVGGQANQRTGYNNSNAKAPARGVGASVHRL